MTTDLPPSDRSGDVNPNDSVSASVGMPRWVKVLGILGLVLLLFLLITLLLGVDHGPGMHGMGHRASLEGPHRL